MRTRLDCHYFTAGRLSPALLTACESIAECLSPYWRFRQSIGSLRARGRSSPACRLTYDAVYIIVDAMKRSGSIQAKEILAAMPSTSYTGVIGTTRFDAQGDLKQSAISLYQYVNGKQSLLDVVKM